MTSSTFTNRIKVGESFGIPSKDTIGTTELIKTIQVTASSQLVSAALPTNASLTRPPYLVMSSAFGVSAGVRINFGVPGNVNKYATISGLNAVQATVMNVSALNIRDIGGDIVITVSAVSGSNPAAGGGVIHIPYIISRDAD